MPYDYLLVGCGLHNIVLARELTNAGKKCFIIDRRSHIGGNCYDVLENGIYKHVYGGHFYHCNNDFIWNYVNKFSKFFQYVFVAKAHSHGVTYSYPINLMTMQQLWGVQTPEDARKKVESVRIKIDSPANFEEKVLSLVGEEIYDKFFYGYNYKHWKRDPKELDASLINRIVIRYNYDDRYFSDKYQAMPLFGYTNMLENMLSGIPVRLNCEFDKSDERLANTVVYSGAIDEYYNYKFGELEYRGVSHEYSQEETGTAMLTYPDMSVPYTRKFSYGYPYGIEDKFLTATEYPSDDTDKKAYPVNTQRNRDLYEKYKNISNDKVVFAGRLGTYKYINMDTTIENALGLTKELLRVR